MGLGQGPEEVRVVPVGECEEGELHFVHLRPRQGQAVAPSDNLDKLNLLLRGPIVHHVPQILGELGPLVLELLVVVHQENLSHRKSRLLRPGGPVNREKTDERERERSPRVPGAARDDPVARRPDAHVAGRSGADGVERLVHASREKAQRLARVSWPEPPAEPGGDGHLALALPSRQEGRRERDRDGRVLLHVLNHGLQFLELDVRSRDGQSQSSMAMISHFAYQ